MLVMVRLVVTLLLLLLLLLPLPLLLRFCDETIIPAAADAITFSGRGVIMFANSKRCFHRVDGNEPLVKMSPI